MTLRQWPAFAVFIAFTFILSIPGASIAQPQFKKFANLFTEPESYVVNYTKLPPKIDGDTSDAVWQRAKWTNNFRDIEGDLKPNPPLQTKVKMLWDDTCLYIAATIRDPHVWATLTHHDDIVFHDNDIELFIDPYNTTHQYFELEFNPINTVFDLFLTKPYRNFGNPLINWNAEGLRTAVKIQGTLNNPSDTDRGWTIEIAIPFKSICLGINMPVPIADATWRINFSRVEWDTKVVNGKYVKLKDSTGRTLPEHNWVWSPQGVINMHFPERWGYLQFNKDFTQDKPFVLPYAELQKRYLWLVYYEQKQWRDAHHAYQPSLAAFGLDNNVTINNHINNLKLEATGHQFIAFITDETDKITWSINQEGLIRQINSRSDE